VLPVGLALASSSRAAELACQRRARGGHYPNSLSSARKARRSLHTKAMNNQPVGDGGAPAAPENGDVRFGSAGRLEIFDGVNWVPLQRVSDTETSPVFRFDPTAQPPTQEPADDVDPPASP
jgi:hypothetical protein